MFLGTAYYPEHWPEQRWAVDAALMREAGLTVVRLAEFAWCRLEPDDGRYEFDWLDRALQILHAEGLRAILCTPTPTPPAWLVEQYPNLLPRDEFGHVRGFGARHHRCVQDPDYRRKSLEIVRRMAEHYREHPAVFAWQIDNEWGCHGTTRCYCNRCGEAFRQWLKDRYGELDRLNSAWGTVFWSQQYSSWSQVPVPRLTPVTPSGHNPSLLLDYYRFASDAVIRFQKEQIELLRAANPQWIITHNLMGRFDEIDYERLAADLDVVGWDNYPQWEGGDYAPAATAHDLMRGLKQKNFWVLEQASGPGGSATFSPTPRPGQMRLWVFQAIAHGADAVVFFRWRTCRFGAEQYWHGILYHDGKPRRRYRELVEIGVDLKELEEELAGSEPHSHVALLHDYEDGWALQIQPHVEGGAFGFRPLSMRYARALERLGVTTDIVSPRVNLSRYRVVIAPPLYLADEALASRLEDYVSGGGTLILSPRSGVKDPCNVVHDERLPGPLRRLAGIVIDEYDAVGPGAGMANTVVWGRDREGYAAGLLCEVLDLESAKPIALYRKDYYASRPAIARNAFGQGLCYYIGTVLEESFYVNFFGEVLRKAGIELMTYLPEGVEVATRTKGDTTYVFLLNHSGEQKTVSLGRTSYIALPGGETQSRKVVLSPYGCVVLKQEG